MKESSSWVSQWKPLAAILAFSCLAAALPVRCEQTEGPPVIRAAVVSIPPKIDGALDDECWKSCVKLTGFKETNYCRVAAEQTEVRICCDADNLYVAFECYDSQPSLIRAEQKQRNYDIYSDDYVGVQLDAMHAHREHYRFEVNAAGTQNESIPSGAAGNITWRGDWYAAAKVNETGWCAEMMIPFRGLRYPAKADSFGISFRRYVPRIDERSMWPDLGPNHDQTRYADLVDLQLPRQRSRPVLMPYMVTSIEPGRTFSDVGLDFKQELPNSVIRMLTYNPDFTDVQDAVASVGYSYTERYLPERRPFFQEGSGLFPDSPAFYSRRIGDINWGFKQFGKVGRHTFAFLDALKEGEGNHFASTYAYDIGQDAGVAMFFTGSTVKDAYKEDSSEPDSSICLSPGVFRNWRKESGTTTLACRWYNSINSDGHPSGSSLKASLAKDAAAGRLGYSIGYDSTDSDYYVRDAYIPYTGVRGLYGRLTYYTRPSSGNVNEWNYFGNTARYRFQGGGLHHEQMAAGVSMELKNEWRFGTSFSNGSWLGEKDSTTAFQMAWRTRHLYGGGSLGYLTGKRAGQDYAEMWIDQSLRVTPRIVLSCSYEWSDLKGPAPERNSQFTVLGNYEITPERSLGLWAVGRDGDLNLCFTYKQTVRSGSDIYLIYGYPNTLTTERRIALKAVRPIVW